MNIIEQIVEHIATERGKNIDTAVQELLPKWKWKLLKKYPSRTLMWLLGVNLILEVQDKIGDLGAIIKVKVNNKTITIDEKWDDSSREEHLESKSGGKE